MFKKALTLFIITLSLSSAQTFQWVKLQPVNITTNPTYLQSAVTIDANGRPVSSHLINNNELYGQTYFGDFAIVKRDPSGSVTWSKTLFGKANIIQLCSDSQGNLLGAGTFRDTIYFNPSLLVTSVMINEEGFFFKMDPSGNVLWLKKASQLSQDIIYNTRITSAENGTFWITSSDNQLNSTLKKFADDGTPLASIMQTNVRYIFSIDIDGSGNIWVTGFTFQGFISFNGFNSSAPYSYTEYIVKYSSSGVYQWVQYVEDVTANEYKIVCDNSGNAYIGGNLFDSTWFGNIKAYGPSWIYDFFVTKIDGNGNFIWLREVPFGNTLGDATVGNGDFLSYSSDDNVYMTGFIRNSINFGGGITVNSLGSRDVLVLKYSASGDLHWAKNAGSISDETGSSIINGAGGITYLTGRMYWEGIFDTITVNGENINTFVAKISESIIPVELTSFTATYSNEEVLLNWSTASENNNKGFDVERSISGNNEWMKIGFVDGNGTTTKTSYYSFTDKLLSNGLHKYRLKQLDFNGSFEYSDIIEVDAVTPVKFSLVQNYPNPFNPVTTISYSLPAEGFVNLSVYNAIGEKVTVLVNAYKPAGIYNVLFNGEKLRSGVYFYRLTSSDFTSTMKMVLNK